mmetsp:Transcript_22998/g.44687  ORF Transcript_22998/g.44687 Transcript_22998/m.44687 type:complete len:289 (+) Transcript_22998:239-1105(+)
MHDHPAHDDSPCCTMCGVSFTHSAPTDVTAHLRNNPCHDISCWPLGMDDEECDKKLGDLSSTGRNSPDGRHTGSHDPMLCRGPSEEGCRSRSPRRAERACWRCRARSLLSFGETPSHFARSCDVRSRDGSPPPTRPFAVYTSATSLWKGWGCFAGKEALEELREEPEEEREFEPCDLDEEIPQQHQHALDPRASIGGWLLGAAGSLCDSFMGLSTGPQQTSPSSVASLASTHMATPSTSAFSSPGPATPLSPELTRRSASPWEVVARERGSRKHPLARSRNGGRGTSA